VERTILGVLCSNELNTV